MIASKSECAVFTKLACHVFQEGYTACHEAVANGDPELLSLILHARDLQKYHTSVAAIPDLLKKIRHTQDFYVEMK